MLLLKITRVILRHGRKCMDITQINILLKKLIIVEAKSKIAFKSQLDFKLITKENENLCLKNQRIQLNVNKA